MPLLQDAANRDRRREQKTQTGYGTGSRPQAPAGIMVLHMISRAKRIQQAAIDFAVLCKIEASRALFALTRLTTRVSLKSLEII